MDLTRTKAFKQMLAWPERVDPYRAVANQIPKVERPLHYQRLLILAPYAADMHLALAQCHKAANRAVDEITALKSGLGRCPDNQDLLSFAIRSTALARDDRHRLMKQSLVQWPDLAAFWNLSSRIAADEARHETSMKHAMRAELHDMDKEFTPFAGSSDARTQNQKSPEHSYRRHMMHAKLCTLRHAFDEADEHFHALLENPNPKAVADILYLLSQKAYLCDAEEYKFLLHPSLVGRIDARRLFPEGHFDRFNERLKSHTLSHPSKMRIGGDTRGVQFGTPQDGPKSVIHDADSSIETLKRMFERLFDAYISAIPKIPGHPFKILDPSQVKMTRLWGNIYHEVQRDNPHHHRFNYVTGVYFAAMPDEDTNDAGCFEIGRPQWPFEAAEQDIVKIAPHVGEVLFLPSYISHNVAKGVFDTPRITFACDFTVQQAVS